MAVDCLIENFKLEFDPRTDRTHNVEGAEIRVKKAASLEYTESITDSGLVSVAYFEKIVHRSIDNFGYKRDVSIRGCLYDFRKAPNELRDYLKHMQNMVEDMHTKNNRRRVTFICHLMGCNNVLYFLQRQTKAWKDQFVRRAISLAAPWGGTMNALRAVVFGEYLHCHLQFDENKLRAVQMKYNIHVFAQQDLWPSIIDKNSYVVPKQCPDISSKTLGLYQILPKDLLS